MAKDKSRKPAWDTPPRKVSAHAKLKNLSAEDQETLWLLLHPVDPEATPPITYEAAMVHVLEAHDISCAVSTFSEWHSWYALNLRMDRADERAHQARLRLAEDPDITDTELDRICARIFKAEAMEKRDGKAWAVVKKVEQVDQKLSQNDRKLAQDDTKLSQDDRRLVLLEAKAKQLDEAKAKAKELKTGGGLSAETLEVIEKQLKLL